jgi:hypothetical protein
MQLAIYDLLGALFSPSDPMLASLHADKLFKRVCAFIRDRFTNPDFGPYDVAVETGISLRYLQKLFTARKNDVRSFHTFGSSGSRGASYPTSCLDEDGPAFERHRLRLRLSRLYPFCARISSPVWLFAGRPRASSIAGVGDDMVRSSTYQRA